MKNEKEIKDGFKEILAQYAEEQMGGTPSHIIAEYLFTCLENFNTTGLKLTDWYTK